VLVAITGQGKTRGTVALLGIEATINQHIAYLTLKSAGTTPEFLQLALAAAYSTLRALSDDSGSTKGALTCEDLKRFKVALPPFEEQSSLIVAIRTGTKEAEAGINCAERQISLIREYRTRLIADVVTGKLDVREAAAGLPDESDEPEEPELLEEAEEMSDEGLGVEDAKEAAQEVMV
jgi:type I restriction enzyme, S subunit